MEEQKAAFGIAGIATKYGLIQGVLSFIVFLVTALAHIPQNWITSAVSIGLLILLMVLAHREFKRTHDGMMTYPQGLGSGTLLSIVSSVISSALVYVYVKFIGTGYIAAAMHAQQAALAQRGMTGAQAQQAMAITSMVMTPVGIVVTSLISGIVLGFIVALIVSIFTQKGDPLVVT